MHCLQHFHYIIITLLFPFHVTIDSLGYPIYTVVSKFLPDIIQEILFM